MQTNIPQRIYFPLRFFISFNFYSYKMAGKSFCFLHHILSSLTGHLSFNYGPPLTPPQEGNVELRRSSGGAVIWNANNAKDTNSRKNNTTENHTYIIFNLFYSCENLRVLRHSRSIETAKGTVVSTMRCPVRDKILVEKHFHPATTRPDRDGIYFPRFYIVSLTGHSRGEVVFSSTNILSLTGHLIDTTQRAIFAGTPQEFNIPLLWRG